MKNFSIVIPIKDEEDLIKRNLPSWCNLRPNELILCFDKPAPLNCVETAKRIANEKNVNLRILEVEKNPEYKFHQAWVRRKGFLEAKNDVILTGDIDLYVFPACLKAINLVGKNDIGLVSLSKLRARKGIDKLRNFMDFVARKYAMLIHPERAGKAFFTGLYAIYRPYWLDSEPEYSIKKLEDPKKAFLKVGCYGGYEGEDTHLRNWMIKKHKVLYLADVGALDVRLGLEDRREIQVKIGTKFALEGRSPVFILRHSIIHIRPYVLGAYLHTLSNIVGISNTLYNLIKTSFIFLKDLMKKLLIVFLMKKTFVYERSFEEVVREGCYEYPVSLTIKKVKGEVFVDVGADKGYYSIFLRKNFKRIYAFEPSEKNYNVLKKNIEKFKAKNIIPLKKAVFNIDGKGIMYLGKYESSGNVMTSQFPIISEPKYAKFIPFKHEIIGLKSVECVSLSSFFENEEKIDLIKVDVEGGEWKVLEGAEKIMNKIERWVIELHQIERRKEMINYLKSKGYKTKILDFGDITLHIYAWR